MSNERSPITPALSTAVIVPSDFCKITTSPEYKRFSSGALRLVVEALDGAPVIVVTDTQTGHAPINVRLVGVSATGHGDYLLYEHVDSQYNSRPDQPSAVSVFKVGTIIPLTEEGSDAKWRAIQAMSVEAMAATGRVRAEGHLDGRYGKMTVRHAVRTVTVSWEALKNAPEGMNQGERFAYWTYPVEELRATV